MHGYISTYWLYKRDTDRCASWLATTALSLGFPRKRFAAAKDDLRKNMHMAHPTAGGGCSRTTTATGQQYRYILRIPQFVELAQFIANKSHSVPQDKLALVRRCISRRLACLKFFEKHGQLAVDNHVYFVEVLIEVVKILEPCAAQQQQQQQQQQSSDICGDDGVSVQHHAWKKTKSKRRGKKGGKGKKAAHGGHRSAAAFSTGTTTENPFGHLELFIIDDDEDDADDTASNDEDLHYRVEDSIDEALCAFMALYTDLNEIRGFLESLWTDCRQRKTDLVTASLTTNTAFQLVEKAHADIMSRYSSLFDAPEDVLFPLVDYAFQLRTGKHLFSSTDSKANRRLDGPPVADDSVWGDDEWQAHDFVHDHFFVEPFLALSSCLKRYRVDGSMPNKVSGEIRPLLSSPVYATLRHRERTRLDWFLTIDAFINLRAFDFGAWKVADGPKRSMDISANSPDALTREMSRCLRGNVGPTILLAFQMRVYIDINRVLQLDNHRGRLEAQAHMVRIKQHLDEAASNDRQPNLCSGHKDDPRETFNNVRYLLEELQCRALGVATEDRGREETWVPEAEIPSLGYHPALCCLQTFRALFLHRNAGGDAASCGGLVLAGLHLYNACNILLGKGPTEDALVWPDIDLELELHGPEKLFSSDVPTGLTEACKAAMGTYGYLEQTVLDVLHGGPLRLERAHKMAGKHDTVPRLDRLSNDSAFLSIFTDMTCTCANHRIALLQAKINEGSVQGLLADLNAKQLRQARKDAAAGKPTSKAHAGRGSRSRRALSLVELLSVLASGLSADAQDLCFDYMALHTRCTRIFEAVYKALEEGRAVLGGDDDFPKAWRPMQAVIKTLVDIHFWQDVGRRFPGRHFPRIDAQRALLLRVAGTMRDALDEVGADVECQRLKAMLPPHAVDGSATRLAANGPALASGDDEMIAESRTAESDDLGPDR